MSIHAERLSRLGFIYPWRTYQRLMLARIEQLEQRTLHLVAPPGSGKTIVGLELIRRGGGPAVVLSPTTTIAGQWADKVSLFTDDAALARDLCSTDPAELSTINVFTYQRVSVQRATDDRLADRARREWAEQLVADGQVADADAADARIAQMRDANPDRYRRQLRTRSRRLRRALIDEGGDVEAVLHDNALTLIDALVALDVRTVVLDECHHLLDHWALVVRALVDRLPNAKVVGLTATPPDPDDRTSYENYTAILGDIDFEVPTPAVVKEGDLAPWRDLAYFVRPTEPEARLLRNADEAFLATVRPLLDEERLHHWAASSLFGHNSDRAGHLASHLAAHPSLAVAQGRLVAAAGRWPQDVPAPLEVTAPLDFDDQLALVERFGLDVLALSDSKADHQILKGLRDALRGFGLTLTERGLRQSRSAGDLVLALSAAKDQAVVDILTREAADLDARLRAVVITDFATMSSGAAKLGAGLAPDAGSAVRVFHALIDDPATEQLDPMLVTGSSVLVDADHGDELLAALNDQLTVDRLDATCHYQPTDHPQVREIVGTGQDWTPATYVRLITEVFETGATRCLVGTRGLFGEGWDSLSLNTLVDLTAVTTSTGVQQLRGRSIRLDPTWPDKVAHNWDVVCVAPDYPRGDGDLQRLIRRHRQSWGVVPPVRVTDHLRATAGSPFDFGEPVAPTAASTQNRAGRIVRGIGHVSPVLAWQVATVSLSAIDIDLHTSTCLRAIGARAGSHDLWDVGSDYDNFVTRATVLDVQDLHIRTVHSLNDTLKALARRVGAAAAVGAGLGAARGATEGMAAPSAGFFGLVAVGAVIGVLALLVINRRDVISLLRKLFVEQPPDAILLDVGRALLEALQRSSLVSAHLQPEYVRVTEQADGTYEVLLDYASEADGACFVDAYRQVFAPITDQRYLIWRTDQRLPSLPLTALWLPLRQLVRARIGRPTYHPVPDLLAVNRERADAFATAWRRRVGGGRLVYTRTEEGRRVLLEARAQPRRSAKGVAFERWR